jgi:hypothetical protein
MSRLKKIFSREPWLAWLLVTLVTVITYAPQIPQLGFYQDDWYMLWSGQARGASSIMALFTTDRPFMGVIYSLEYSLLGDHLLYWHLWALLLKLVGVWALLWLLRMLWPRQKFATTAITLIFIVYPGFLSQPISTTFQNHLFTYGAAILSIALLVAAVQIASKTRRIVLYLLSLVCTVLYLPVYEYMIGLEAVKLLFLWLALQQKEKFSARQQLWRMAKWYAPFALVAVAFVYWRFFIFESTRKATSEIAILGSFSARSLRPLLTLIVDTTKDFMDTAVYAWGVPPYRLFAGATYSSLGFTLLWAGLAVLLVFGYLRLVKSPETTYEAVSPDFSLWLMLAGIFAVFVTLLPVDLAGREVIFNGFERYTLQASLGVGLLFIGLLLAVQSKLRTPLLLFILALGVSTHILNATDWARTWQIQREAWWQLTWRAPDIADDTLVMLYLPENRRLQQDYEAWGPLNLIYNPGPTEAPQIQAEVLNRQTAYDVLQQLERENQVREVPVWQDFHNLLLLTVPSGYSCLHVIDGQLPVYSEYEDLLVKQVGEYSHPERILTGGASPTPPRSIFGAELAHGWCYTYQLASLDRQQGDWAEIARLGDQAIAAGLEPLDKSEWVPFIEAYANLGRYEDAQRIFNQNIKGRRELRLPLCRSLAVDPGYPPEFGYDYESVYTILCDS